MWKIRRPITTALNKTLSLVTGIMVTLLSWFLCYAKGKIFVLGIVAGISAVLFALFSKVSEKKR